MLQIWSMLNSFSSQFPASSFHPISTTEDIENLHLESIGIICSIDREIGIYKLLHEDNTCSDYAANILPYLAQ